MKVKIHLPQCHICQLTIHGRFSALYASGATPRKNQDWGGLGTRLALRVEFPREGQFSCALVCSAHVPLDSQGEKRRTADGKTFETRLA